MKLILLESYEADLSNSGYNIQFGEELTEIQTNLYSVCKHSDTFLAHCTSFDHTNVAHEEQCFLGYQVTGTRIEGIGEKKGNLWP